MAQLEVAREIDSRSATTMSARVQSWIDNKRADEELELKRIAQDETTGPVSIRIEGGMDKAGLDDAVIREVSRQ
jgi:hypothetical protein